MSRFFHAIINIMSRTQNLVRTTLPGWCGVAALFLTFQALRPMEAPPYIKASVLIGALYLTMFCVEAVLSIRGRFGLLGAPCQRKMVLSRILVKITGWIVTIFCVSSAYWLFPEYLNDFYQPYFQALAVMWPCLVCFFLFCILWEDPRAQQEYDDYYWVGLSFLKFKISYLKNTNLKQHLLAWAVKLYFLPLMFVYLVNYNNFHFDGHDLMSRYDSMYNGIFFIDTAFVCVGYIFANNLIDTNIRSTEPTLLGWVSALICYQPFWTVIGSSYINYGSAWGPWLNGHPCLQAMWAFLIILCLIVFVWTTISFGSRFSNLTHRGILVCGPYAYLRHPAYVSKLVSFFLIYVPFVGKDLVTIVRSCALWAMLAGVYYLRAKTEEAHLRSLGPEYDIYTKEIAQNWKKLLKFRKC